MADKKISQLTAATTPLAGTEVLPIVQGGSTVKVSVENVLTSAQPSGVANGVVYLNGAKIASSGTALAFDGANLGVGVAAPLQKLHVATAGNNYIVSHNTAGSTSALLVGAENGQNTLYSWTTPSGATGRPLAVYAGATEHSRFETDGDYLLQNGNLVIGTAAKGIDFSANTGNVLDQYKFADFTPTWTAVTTNPVLNNGTIVGSYVRIGKNCTFQFSVTMGSTTTFGTGEWRFTAPFTASKTGVGSAWALDSGTAYYIGAAKIEAGSNLVYIWTSGNATAWAPAVPFTWAVNDRVEVGISFTV